MLKDLIDLKIDLLRHSALGHPSPKPDPAVIREIYERDDAHHIGKTLGADNRRIQRWMKSADDPKREEIPLDAWHLVLILTGRLPANHLSGKPPEAFIELLELSRDPEYHKTLRPRFRPLALGFEPPTGNEVKETFWGYSTEELSRMLGRRSLAIESWMESGDEPSPIRYPAWRLFLISTALVPAI